MLNGRILIKIKASLILKLSIFAGSKNTPAPRPHFYFFTFFGNLQLIKGLVSTKKPVSYSTGFRYFLCIQGNLKQPRYHPRASGKRILNIVPDASRSQQ